MSMVSLVCLRRVGSLAAASAPPTRPLKSYQWPVVWKNLRPTFWTNLNLSFYRQTTSEIISCHQRRVFWRVKFLDLWRDPSFSFRTMTSCNVRPVQSPIRLEILRLRYENKLKRIVLQFLSVLTIHNYRVICITIKSKHWPLITTQDVGFIIGPNWPRKEIQTWSYERFKHFFKRQKKSLPVFLKIRPHIWLIQVPIEVFSSSRQVVSTWQNRFKGWL